MRVALLVLTMISLTASGSAAQTSLETAPVGTLAQLMRGIYFPNSNLIFDVQMRDPAPATNSGRGWHGVEHILRDLNRLAGGRERRIGACRRREPHQQGGATL